MRWDFSRRGLVILLSALVLASGTANAQEESLPKPTDKVILSVSGNIAVTNSASAAQFDRAMLEALGTTSFTTQTPWYTGPVSFEGVPMKTLLQRLGAKGTTVVATALNDYSVEIPISDFTAHGVILALKRDGKYMTVQDKGPLFIVYPYDSDPALSTQKFYSRSVWQVSRILVK